MTIICESGCPHPFTCSACNARFARLVDEVSRLEAAVARLRAELAQAKAGVPS